MSVAKTIEITAESLEGFDDALRTAVRKASQTVDDIKGAWIANQEVSVKNGEVEMYRVHTRITFVLKD